MFEIYHPPFTTEAEDTKIIVEKQGDDLIYKRLFRGKEEKELVLLNNDGDITINPIEPVNLPEAITSFLLIEFKRSAIIRSGDKKKIYLKFPVEIGVFISDKSGNHEVIDIFTFNKVKYTLYGSHTQGIICRHWESDIYTDEPDTEKLYEGFIELDIANESNHQMEITNAIFNAYGMKIYFGDKRLGMKASMKIINKLLAETDFSTYPTTSRFKRSMELYTARKLAITSTKGIMEFGI
ncbi:hypothetical protein SAMN04488589_0145 [Methanolobus vulcani]|uniref:DUF432 domain-containing protein n=1 Tax=Methanolobus vulcani TaxID=38026 RepID=A0A7Z7FBJ1_9EURY|nr:DUF432 domain-containing protein [Methanolobus vulcani]SDF25896.1 hypothetical protein SAMN04488589_0145 [Methanolobus vulcani]